MRRTFRFKNYYETIAFVNALAWMAHSEDHHPDLAVGYNRCAVTYSTHSVSGLSENDFICAARIDTLSPAAPERVVAHSRKQKTAATPTAPADSDPARSGAGALRAGQPGGDRQR